MDVRWKRAYGNAGQRPFTTRSHQFNVLSSAMAANATTDAPCVFPPLSFHSFLSLAPFFPLVSLDLGWAVDLPLLQLCRH